VPRSFIWERSYFHRACLPRGESILHRTRLMIGITTGLSMSTGARGRPEEKSECGSRDKKVPDARTDAQG